jgi:hypothetical protein
MVVKYSPQEDGSEKKHPSLFSDVALFAMRRYRCNEAENKRRPGSLPSLNFRFF